MIKCRSYFWNSCHWVTPPGSCYISSSSSLLTLWGSRFHQLVSIWVSRMHLSHSTTSASCEVQILSSLSQTDTIISQFVSISLVCPSSTPLSLGSSEAHPETRIERQVAGNISRAVVLTRRERQFSPPGISGNRWRYFWLLQFGGGVVNGL